MTAYLKDKAIGFYVSILAFIFGIISLIRFLLWAPAHDAMDIFIILAFLLAIASDIFLMFRENCWLLIVAVVGYSAAVVKLLTNSVGSFVDAYQGIGMFGDATQVGTIISISITIFIGVLLSIIASFLSQRKGKETS